MATEFEKYDPAKHGPVSRKGRRQGFAWAGVAEAARSEPVFVPRPSDTDIRLFANTASSAIARHIDRTERVQVNRLGDHSGLVIQVLPR